MRDFFRTLAPERFEADVWVHADGSYTYSYYGNLIFVPALIQRCRAGYLEAHFEAQLKNAAAQLIQEGFQSAEYLGGGRYHVVLESSRASGQPSYFPSREMKVFSILNGSFLRVIGPMQQSRGADRATIALGSQKSPFSQLAGQILSVLHRRAWPLP